MLSTTPCGTCSGYYYSAYKHMLWHMELGAEDIQCPVHLEEIHQAEYKPLGNGIATDSTTWNCGCQYIKTLIV